MRVAWVFRATMFFLGIFRFRFDFFRFGILTPVEFYVFSRIVSRFTFIQRHRFLQKPLPMHSQSYVIFQWVRIILVWAWEPYRHHDLACCTDDFCMSFDKNRHSCYKKYNILVNRNHYYNSHVNTTIIHRHFSEDCHDGTLFGKHFLRFFRSFVWVLLSATDYVKQGTFWLTGVA